MQIHYNVAQGQMTPPIAPPTLPQYIADGLPKQDDKTLQDARSYIDELLDAREQRRQEPVTRDEIPDEAELVEDEITSAVYLEYRTCGDGSCSCMSGGEKHGPYKYRAYRDGDIVRREYLGKANESDN